MSSALAGNRLVSSKESASEWLLGRAGNAPCLRSLRLASVTLGQLDSWPDAHMIR